MKSYEYQRASKHWIIASLDKIWRRAWSFSVQVSKVYLWYISYYIYMYIYEYLNHSVNKLNDVYLFRTLIHPNTKTELSPHKTMLIHPIWLHERRSHPNKFHKQCIWYVYNFQLIYNSAFPLILRNQYSKILKHCLCSREE